MFGARQPKPIYLAVYLCIGLIWWAVLSSPRMVNIIGLGTWGPFFDLQGVLAASEDKSNGLDPFAPLQVDTDHRPFIYSTWWLWAAAKAGWVRADTVWLGFALVAATLSTAAWFFPLRNWRAGVIAGLTMLSPAWMLTVYRANNDLVIFILLALIISALQRAYSFWRLIAAAVTGLMVVLKYYPVAAVIGILRAPHRREMVELLGVVAAVVVLGWSSLSPAIASMTRNGTPYSSGLRAFGAAVLPNLFSSYFSAGLGWMLASAAGIVGYLIAHGAAPATPATPAGANRFMTAALGGAVMIGCFFIGTSYTYKLVFAWLILPWLVYEAPETLGRGRTFTILALLLLVCWADGLALSLFKIFNSRWTQTDRIWIMQALPPFTTLTQIFHWIIIGVCFRLASAWSFTELARLKSAEA